MCVFDDKTSGTKINVTVLADKKLRQIPYLRLSTLFLVRKIPDS